MLLAVLLGLLFSISILFFGKQLKAKWSPFLLIIPVVLFIYFLSYIPALTAGNIITQHLTWVPSLGVNFDFRLDGLSSLFCLMITGIGIAVFTYARKYLRGDPYLDRFFAYIYLFMAAMLGLVLSDNIILLFIFWELTSISSFFLIGFNNNDPKSRKSALTALSITGLGGFFLLAALILIGNIAGTWLISDLIAARDTILADPRYPLIIGLLFLGAFTKSAQFPFHFWLPGAMQAPTPVSAYLHSATMVKAGIYLLARFTPLLGGTVYWNYTLMIVGGITMLYASFHALFRTDLKGILAYSTISALGILTFLIGLGTKNAFIAVAVFIVTHALYKATLFLVTGIIDHETGTRNITKLSGLKKVLPPVALAGLLAALSSAGFPFLTIGFISKDLMYETTLTFIDQNLSWLLTLLILLTNTGLVAAGFMAGITPFKGKLSEAYKNIHLPYKGMWIPPLVLALLGVVFGCFPHLVGDFITNAAANTMYGMNTHAHLAIWHGWNTVLFLSLGTLALGTLVYLANKPSAKKLAWIEQFNQISPQHIIESISDKVLIFSQWYTDNMHNGYLRSYHLKIILFTELILAYKLWLSGPIYVDFWSLTYPALYEVAIVMVFIGALYLMLTTASRLTAVVSMSVIGYCTCLIFVIYSAPDLAMTQFTIDTLSTVLFVLVLYRLPGFINFTSKKILFRDAVVASIFGIIIALIAFKMWEEPIVNDIADFYGENAYLLAKGKNVVNVILVDFRGIDTMFETIVLSIAAIGVYSMIRLRLKSSEKE